MSPSEIAYTLGIGGTGIYTDIGEVPLGVVSWMTMLESRRLIGVLDAELVYPNHLGPDYHTPVLVEMYMHRENPKDGCEVPVYRWRLVAGLHRFFEAPAVAAWMMNRCIGS